MVSLRFLVFAVVCLLGLSVHDPAMAQDGPGPDEVSDSLDQIEDFLLLTALNEHLIPNHVRYHLLSTPIKWHPPLHTQLNQIVVLLLLVLLLE